MGNKETLQQHNTRLSENNIEIEDILSIANSLPTIDEVISLQDKTIKPSTIDQTITADENYNGLGTVTVKGDSDLIPENIKKGVNIFGVEGEIEVIDYWNKEKASGVGSSSFSIPLHLRIIPKKINASYISSLSGTFRNYYSLEEADFSEWEFHQTVNNLNGTFYGCRVLKKVDITNLNTINVTDMGSMFYNCKSLESLDLSNFNTANVTKMGSMFERCSSLQKLDIRNFTFDNVTSYSYIFDGIPVDCEIIVKSDTERDWVLARRSDLTNVKTVAEL
jgi:surface protein